MIPESQLLKENIMGEAGTGGEAGLGGEDVDIILVCMRKAVDIAEGLEDLILEDGVEGGTVTERCSIHLADVGSTRNLASSGGTVGEL